MLPLQRVGIELIDPLGMRGPSKKPLAALVLAVLLIHVLLISWWHTQRSNQDIQTQPSPFALRVRATVMKAAAAPEVSSPSMDARSTPDAAEWHASLESAAPIPTQAENQQSDHPVAVAASHQAPVASEPLWRPIPSHYFSDEQVDTLPIPKEDWLLDWQAAPTGAMGWVMTLRLWVSALGDIDHVEVLDAKPAGDWGARMVISFARTPMFPATLAGQAVPVTYVVSLAPDMAQ
ncbi:MAG: hypothetical protein ACK4F8_04660 [Aquabacterium sp.]